MTKGCKRQNLQKLYLFIGEEGLIIRQAIHFWNGINIVNVPYSGST